MGIQCSRTERHDGTTRAAPGRLRPAIIARIALRVPSDEEEARQQTFRREHPCRKLTELIAAGYKPTGPELAAVVDMAAPADRDRVRERLAEATVACHRARSAGSLAQARRIAHDLAFELAPVLGPVPRAADSVAGPAGAGFPGFPRSRPGTAMTRRPRHRRYIGGAPVYESWESSAGPRPELVRGPVKPPPAPQTRETLQAAAERQAYFDHLQRRLRAEPSQAPKITQQKVSGTAVPCPSLHEHARTFRHLATVLPTHERC